MANYSAEEIRNVVLVGHAGAGKTSLAEAILHKTGITNRLGSVDEKSSTLDCDEEEKNRGHSVDSALAHISWKGKEINLIDTPGYPDFLGAAISAMIGAETAVIVISAQAGIQTNTRKLFQTARERGMACMIVINKIDSGTEELMNLVGVIQESFGRECVCANLPDAKGANVFDAILNTAGDGAIEDVAATHTNLLETVIEADEALMESYLGGEEISADKLTPAFQKALIAQSVVPIVFTSARGEVGVEPLLDLIAAYAPSPVQGVKHILQTPQGEHPVELAPSGDLLGVVIRSASDAKSHIKYSTVRLLRGTIKSDTSLLAEGRKGMRCGHINKLQGDHLDTLEHGIAGDIITLAKLEEIKTFDTVFTGKDPGKIACPKMPVPMFSLAIEPKNRGDETKISGALTEIADADPTFKISRDTQTNEMVVSGLGELHVRVILARMQSRRKIEVVAKPPQIPYLETITRSVQNVEYTHKKQSGGAGQFAKVFIDMEPNERGKGYEFIDKIFGGSIDQSFRPSVDKGCQSAMAGGVIAGFPVVDVKVSLVDGKTHPVDSKDIAFQIAGRNAFKKAFLQCAPCLLEPIVHLEVTVPSENVGDITGDLAGRRGRVQGQDVLPGNLTVIKAQVPLAEIQQYNSQLKSVTGGQGSFTMELSHYEPVPPNIQQQIIAKRQVKQEEEE